MSLQEALKRMRLELDMTQADLAEKLDRAFITVNRWENGKGFPSRENAKSILNLAKSGPVSKACYTDLYETLMPDLKRSRSAAAYGFPDIDRDFLFQLADGSTNALYVIEEGTYQLLYANRSAEQFAVSYLMEKGEVVDERRLAEQSDRRCFHYFGNRSTPCPFCALDRIETEMFQDFVNTIPESGRTIQTHAKAAKWKGRNVYIFYLTDITGKQEERNALYELTNDILDGVGIYHLFFDDRIELVFMNETFYKMIGAERKEALLKHGESDLSLIHPEDRASLWAEIKSAIAQQRAIDSTMRMRVADGQYHTVHLNGKQIKQDAEKWTFYCLFHDIEQ